MLENITLESALLQFAKAFQALNKGREKVTKLTATLKETVKVCFEVGGRPKDCFCVLESQGIAFNTSTIESYFAGLTPADEKQNKGGNKNPAIAKADKALSEARGDKVAATKQSESINDSMVYIEPFIAKANTEAGNTSAKANASDLEKLEAALEEAKAIAKGARAAATAAVKLVKQREEAIRLYKKASAEAAKVTSNAKADKATATKAKGKRAPRAAALATAQRNRAAKVAKATA